MTIIYIFLGDIPHNKPKRLEPLNYALWQEKDIPMSKNEERKKPKDYDRNFLKWIRKLRKRLNVPLFLLVFAAVIFGIGFILNSLIRHF
jgi:hypothetical protein